MNTRSNPFRPTFGVPPLYWVGRTAVLDAFRNALQSPAGASARTMIVSGARGIGKTVLLNELEDSAKAQGWICIRASGRTNMVEELVETTIPRLIEQLAPRDKRKINRIGIGGVGSIGLEHNTDEPYKPTLNTRLRDLLAQLSGVGILLSIDEVQDASVEDLTSIAVAYQDLLRDELDISFVAAGLPQGVNRLLDLPGVTFLRRAQRFVLGPLSAGNAAEAFTATAADSGLNFSSEAISKAVELSKGYPYLVQLVGSLAWERAYARDETQIEASDVDSIADEAISILCTQVHLPAASSLPPAQRQFLDSMSSASVDGIATITEIAESQGRTVRSLSATRQRLIDADLIEPAAHGELQFVIPYMERFFNSTDKLGRVD
ncbi:AAA family ATPase [Corynebacterium striatum]|uniref:AAA family ATPase n=1 Tax=Corynebacterium striatum TaxID=43770 RepID=UPI003B59451B